MFPQNQRLLAHSTAAITYFDDIDIYIYIWEYDYRGSRDRQIDRQIGNAYM